MICAAKEDLGGGSAKEDLGGGSAICTRQPGQAPLGAMGGTSGRLASIKLRSPEVSK